MSGAAKCGSGAGGGGARRGGERLGVAVACAVVLFFYGWTVWSTGEPWRWGKEQKDYYNLLIDGWRAGQLHMKVEVPEALLKLADPYDPAQRGPGLGLHDASFYRGKYYVYFGVAPVVVLMWPWRALTGVDLPLIGAVLFFVSAGFLASVGMWLEVRRRFFAGSAGIVAVAGVLTLGLVSPAGVLLRRPDMWELPIAGGFFFAMAALWCVLRSVTSAAQGGRTRWLAGAGLALGLAVASRPTYLFAMPLLLVPWVGWWWRERRLPWREGLAALAPLAAVGAALAGHNYARFGDALEFGQAYQFSLDYEAKLPHFAARYVPYNVAQHFFGAAEWERYFPFVRAPEIPPAPEGYTQHRGDVFGLLANYPVAWLALLAPWAGWRRSGSERWALVGWVGAVAVLGAGTAGVMCMFFSALARYQVEFGPAWVLLAAVGLLVAEAGARGREGLARVMRAGLMVLAGGSAIVAVLAGMQLDGLLRGQNPELWERLARRANGVSALVERGLGVKHGAVAMTVRLPQAGGDGEEVLLECVGEESTDRVVWRREPDGGVRLGVQHGEAPTRWSEPVAWAAGETRRVWVTMGSMYPPETHAYFGGADAATIRRMRRRAGVAVEGRVVLEEYFRFAAGGSVRVGRAVGFRGEVSAVERGVAGAPAAEGAWQSLAETGETVRLTLRLPEGREEGREPLVVTGRTGAADFVYVEYLAGGAVRFGFDHWGAPGATSEPVRVERTRELEIEVTMGSLATVANADRAPVERRGKLRVAVAGVGVLEGETEFYTAEPEEVWVGRNPLGGTSCAERFTGELSGATRARAVVK